MQVSEERSAHRLRGGGRGIRTPGTVSRTSVFKTDCFNRSHIPPRLNTVYQPEASAEAQGVLLRPVWINEYLAGLARLEASHRSGEIFHRDAICDHGVKIEFAGFEQCRHLKPRLIHAAAVDALNGKSLKD